MSDSSIYSGMLQEFNVTRIRRMNAERDVRLAALRSRADAENYCLEVRSKIASAFRLPERGGVPRHEIVGRFATGICRVEKIIYESRPGLPVTALLYLPVTLNAPAPAVLFLCGHSQYGKDCEVYRSCCLSLVASGYVVLAVDPAGQGERLQFVGAEHADGLAGSCTREHLVLGKQLHLCGEFFGAWRAHDALCGLDYLLSRPEVDLTRVGVTGNSGGGTMTTFVQALDSRFTMAAPSCYVTSWKRNLENELPADVEQIPPGIVGAGCEMGDFILAYAPRPILLLGQAQDIFDPRGLTETFERCRKVYALLGAEDNLRCFIGPDLHGYTLPNRMSMYRFFGEISRMPIPSAEPEKPDLPAETWHCTPTGQVADLPGAKGIHDLIVEKLDALAASRRKLSAEELRRLIAAKLELQSRIPVPYSRILRCSPRDDGNPNHAIFSRFALESEPGILTVLKIWDRKNHLRFPEREELTLYVPNRDAAEELLDVVPDGRIAGVDARGMGESLPLTCDRFDSGYFSPYGREYHYNSCSLLFGGSLLADRVRDVLGAVMFARANGAASVRLAGRGVGAVIATLAALLSDEVEGLKLFDAPKSWDEMARARVSLWPQSVMPEGILKETDLPDIYEALRTRMPVEIVNFADPYFKTEW